MRFMNSVQKIDHLDEECKDARDSVEQTVDDRTAVCTNIEAPFRESSYGKELADVQNVLRQTSSLGFSMRLDVKLRAAR